MDAIGRGREGKTALAKLVWGGISAGVGAGLLAASVLAKFGWAGAGGLTGLAIPLLILGSILLGAGQRSINRPASSHEGPHD